MRSLFKNAIAVAVVVAGLAITAAVSYNLGQSANHDEMAALRDSLNILQSEQKEAFVVKRVSEQMGEIAYQQKAISDAQRERAEEQSLLAQDNAAKAELESKAAREAEGRAIASAQEAENAKNIAEYERENATRQRDEAEHAKNVSDTLNYRTLGKTLGSTSMIQRESKDIKLADHLAYASWYFLNKYKGNTYFESSFKALEQATGQQIQTKLPHSEMSISLSVIPGKKGECVAATSYGELFRVSRNSNGTSVSYETLSANSVYDYRSVWAGRKAVYALSLNGPLCIISYSGGVKTITLPQDKYLKLQRADNNNLLIFGKHAALWYSFESGKIERTVKFGRELSTAVVRKGRTSLFYADGSYAEMDSQGRIAKKPSITDGGVVTAAHYDERSGCLSLGHKSGLVLPLNDDDRIMERLAAHVSRCTDIAMVGSAIVTTGYDRSLYIWSMANLMFGSGLDFAGELKAKKSFKDVVTQENKIATEWLVPVNYKYGAWVFSTCADGDGVSVWIATADGTIRNMNVVVDDMAQKLYSKLDGNMSEQDWMRFVDKTIPYMKFK